MGAMKIGRRFLFSRKSHSIINLVARVSVVAIAVPTVALVVVLSLHNGLTDYIHSMYARIDAPIEVRAVEGARFDVSSEQYDSLAASVGRVSRVVDGQVLARYGDAQTMVTLRGVDSLYAAVTGIESTISRGQWHLEFGGMPRAVLGAGVSYDLGYALASGEAIELVALQRTPPMFSFLPIPFYTERRVVGSGVFTLDKLTDQTTIYVPLSFAHGILNLDSTNVSSLQIAPATGLSNNKAKQIISSVLGDKVRSFDRDEQRGDMYRVMNVEKWVIMFMLICVAMIAALSLSGCMLMMLSEKEEATRTLAVMGMNRKRLRGVFVSLGMWIVGLGLASGVVVGVVLVGVQHYFEVLEMGGASMLISAYPVRISLLDLALVIVAVGTIGYLIVRLTVNTIIIKNCRSRDAHGAF